MTSDLPPDDRADEDEIDRLIRRFGSKTALIEEIQKRKGRRGAKPHKDLSHLIEMARVINEARVRQKRNLQLGRAAGIVADRQNRKPGKERNAVVKKWKRKFQRSEELFLAIAHIYDAGDYALRASSQLKTTELPPQEKVTLALDDARSGLENLVRVIGLLDIVASGERDSTNSRPS